MRLSAVTRLPLTIFVQFHTVYTHFYIDQHSPLLYGCALTRSFPLLLEGNSQSQLEVIVRDQLDKGPFGAKHKIRHRSMIERLLYVYRAE